ncbi:hypothetical protein, partial [Lysobacter niastensis]|uniref:hypothetical protein n=1 Tax=Lysobacter niastensis TaxID=380629 RepID=UPI001E3E9825
QAADPSTGSSHLFDRLNRSKPVPLPARPASINFTSAGRALCTAANGFGRVFSINIFAASA